MKLHEGSTANPAKIMCKFDVAMSTVASESLPCS